MSPRVIRGFALVAAAAFAVGVALVAVPRGSAGSGDRSIPYFEDFNAPGGGFAALQTKVVERSKNAGRGAGGAVYFRSVLRDRKGGHTIGKLVANCATTGFGVDLCRGVIFLAARGSLIIDGTASSSTGAHVRTIPVVGGTQEFAGARGYIESANASDSGPGLDWTIHLLDD